MDAKQWENSGKTVWKKGGDKKVHLHFPHITQVVSKTLGFPGRRTGVEETSLSDRPICLYICQVNTHTHSHIWGWLRNADTWGHMKNLHMLILFTFKTLQKQFVHKISACFLFLFCSVSAFAIHTTHTHTHTEAHRGTKRVFTDNTFYGCAQSAVEHLNCVTKAYVGRMGGTFKQMIQPRPSPQALLFTYSQ